jgi:nucleoside-diphosphate-sugar epimerase
MKRILISGAYGQVGQELFLVLAKKYGAENIVCTDVRLPPRSLGVVHHESLDILNREQLFDLVKKYKVTDLYGLAALLSATGEHYPLYTEHLNMDSLFNCLEAARAGLVQKVFWPSSIAAFGSNTPKRSPQFTVQ